MLVSARSPLTAAAVVVLAAGVVAAGPGLVPSSAPRIVSTPVTLASCNGIISSVEALFGCGPKFLAQTAADLFDPTHSYIYTPNVSGVPVSHPVGLIPELLQDAQNPPILGAVKAGLDGTDNGRTQPFSTILRSPAFDLALKDRVAVFQGDEGAASAVINKVVVHAVHDTVTPSQWGGGKVLNDWAVATAVRNAMTIGIGAEVNDKWVPSIRVAAISARNQIANDILGTQKYPDYARDYTASSDELRTKCPPIYDQSITPRSALRAAASIVKPAASRH